MGRTLVAASVALSVASLGVALWALQENASLRAGLAGSRDVPPAVAALEERLERTEASLGEMRRERGRFRDIGEFEGTITGRPAAGPDGDGGDGAAPDPSAPEPLRALVREVLQEEIRRREAEAAKSGAGKGGGEKKPPLSQFAAELDLAPSQREGVHLAVLKGQEGMISLLRTPTGEGRVPLNDLLDALMGRPEEAQPRMIEIFGMLASEQVPGRTGTYAEGIEGLKRDAVDAFRRDFTPEQFKAFEKMGQDPLEIEVPDSPWIGILQEAYRRRK